MDKIKEDIAWALKLYSLTLVIPIALSIINVIFCGILAFQTKFGFWINLKIIWIDYYFTGIFLDVHAWRWQLALLFCLFLFAKFTD